MLFFNALGRSGARPEHAVLLCDGRRGGLHEPHQQRLQCHEKLTSVHCQRCSRIPPRPSFRIRFHNLFGQEQFPIATGKAGRYRQETHRTAAVADSP